MKEETIEKCPLCDTKKVAGEDSCSNSKCGYEFSNMPEPKPQSELKPSAEQTDDEWLKDHNVGKLIFKTDKISVSIDDSQRLLGRADLKKYTKKDPTLISRSHFTIYRKNKKYFIKDGITNVQDKPSEHNTFVNDEKLAKDERKLENGDRILVSDVEMVFEV